MSNIIIMAVAGAPSITNVTGTVTETTCYNATQTINVAGNGTTFIVQDGGSATMIAGQKISYLPGTTIQSGSYMWGYIAPSGPWCQTPSMPAVLETEEVKLVRNGKSLSTIYPNPTTGNFILEFKGELPVGNVSVCICGIRGEKVMTAVLNGERKHEFSLSDRPAGLYLIQVIAGDKAETVKIIKQ